MRIQLVGLVVLGTAVAAGCLSPVRKASAGDNGPTAAERGLSAAAVVGAWPPVSAMAARRLMARYGAPDEIHADWLVWNENRPWKRTVVRIMTPLDTHAEDRGIVEQTVEYPLTGRQAAVLKAFDPRLSYESAGRELGSYSEREEVNFLRLNLANDIVNRRMTPDQARALFAQILRLEAAGKSSSYLQVLHFPR